MEVVRQTGSKKIDIEELRTKLASGMRDQKYKTSEPFALIKGMKFNIRKYYEEIISCKEAVDVRNRRLEPCLV
jgi:hypothetical protein